MSSLPGQHPPHTGKRLHVQALAHALSDYLHFSECDAATPIPSLTLQPGDIHHFATYILSHQQWSDSPEKIVDLLSFALVPTALPSAGFPSLRHAAGPASKSGVCGKVWKRGELAYKCKICERDPTCVVCVQCFKLGDHMGHDYAMVRTEGGCCDCGDVQAWRLDGFCSMHSGACAEDEDPSKDMPDKLKRELIEAVCSVALHVLELCCKPRTERKRNRAPDWVHRACVLLEWMADVVQCGDGIRRVVGRHLASVPAQPSYGAGRNTSSFRVDGSEARRSGEASWLSVMLEIDGVDKLPMRIQEKLHKVYFQLITDLVFKRAFLEMFVDNYERYIHAQIARRKKLLGTEPSEDRRTSTDIVENFTVQLFTVPALVPVMIRRGGLLDVLIDTMLNLFETCAAPVVPYDTSVPFAESAFANEYQSSRDRDQALIASEPVASSSTSPQAKTRRRRHALPLPFATREAKQKSVLRRKRPASESGPGCTGEDTSLQRSNAASNTQLNGPAWVGPTGGPDQDSESIPVVLLPGPDSSPISEDALQNGDAGEVPPVSASEYREENMEPEEDAEVDEDVEDEGAMSVDGDEVAEVMDEPIGLDEELMEEIHGPLEVGTTADVDMIAAQLEDGGNEMEFADVILRLRQGHHEVGDEQDENDYADTVGMDGRDANIREQLAVFEDGLHFMPPAHARLAKSPTHARSQVPGGPGPSEENDSPLHPRSPRHASRSQPSSPYLSAVNEARRMENPAIVGTGPLAHTMRLDWSHGQQKISEWGTWRVKYDLKYVLTHRAVAFHLVHVRTDLFRKFVRMISMAQGMNPSARRFGDHVPMEADTWAKAFTMEIEMIYHYVELLADAFCGLGSPSAPPTANIGMRPDVADLSASRLRCIAVVRSCLDEWIGREEALEARSVCSGESFSVAHSVSVHLPLHRFLTFMLHHVLRLDGVNLRTALSGGFGEATVEDARRLVRHPLRVQAFLAQVRAGMWRRNGRPIAGQSMLYRSVHYSEWFVDLDLFLQQCCVVVMGPDAYLRETMEAFRIRDFSTVIRLPDCASLSERHSGFDAMETKGVSETSGSGDTGRPSGKGSKENDPRKGEDSRSAATFGLFSLAPKRYAQKGRFPPLAIIDTGNTLSELADFIPTLVEDLLIHIVRILSERSRCGSEESEFLRRKLVHQLCSRDRTHSQLYKACSFRISMELDKDGDDAGLNNNGDKAHSLVESILPAIAEYVEPRGMEQGKYKLKDDLWEEFDSFAPHLSLRDRGAAEVRHAAACERQNRKMQVIPSDNVNDRNIFPQLVDLLPLSVAVSRKGGLATDLLCKALPRNGGPQSIEGSIPPALHLVCASVEISDRNISGPGQCYWLNDCLDEEGLSNSAISPICEMYKISQDSETRVFKEYAPVLNRILNQAKVRGSSLVQRFLSQKVSQSAVSSASMDPQPNGDHRSSQERERRKLILRKKKEQQAAALAQMRLAQANFAKHIDAESPSVTSAPQKADSSQHSKRVQDVNIKRDVIKAENTSVALAKAKSGTNSGDIHEQECALCHDVGRGDGTRLMGLIGFHQKTRLPATAQEQCKIPSYCGEGPVPSESKDQPDSAIHMHIRMRERRESGSGDTNMDMNDSETTSALPNSELRQCFFLNPEMVKNGVESGQNLHVSFCGHSIHIHCFDRYFSSLMLSRANGSVFEGYNVLDLGKLEFLCPVCRRLANMVLPLMNDVSTKDSSKTSLTGKEITSSLPFSEWIERCGLEINKGWSREVAALHIRSRSPSKSTEGVNQVRVQKGEIASTVNALRLSIINSGKAVLQKFGLQSFRGNQATSDIQGGEADKDASVFNSYAKLPSAAISTVACAEIAARSGCWGVSVSQLAQRSLRIVLREARAQISLEPEPRNQGLFLLWNATESIERVKELDPFATFAFLFLLWSEPLNFYEAKNLARLGFNLVQLQRSEDENNSAVTQAKLDLTVLLYLRRATILVSSFFEPLSDPPVSRYSADGAGGHDNVRREILRLMNYFNIPTPPDPNVTEGLKEMNALELQSACLEFRPKRIGLINLPKLFQSLLEELDGRKCSSCSVSPKSPALCLVCGDLLCCNSTNASPCGVNRISSHAKDCGAGIGVFLVLNITSVQVIREDRSSNWGSPYLDAHGEEDENLDRGKPLFLNMERYSTLERLWLTHGFDQDSRILSITMPTHVLTHGF